MQKGQTNVETTDTYHKYIFIYVQIYKIVPYDVT